MAVIAHERIPITDFDSVLSVNFHLGPVLVSHKWALPFSPTANRNTSRRPVYQPRTYVKATLPHATITPLALVGAVRVKAAAHSTVGSIVSLTYVYSSLPVSRRRLPSAPKKTLQRLPRPTYSYKISVLEWRTDVIQEDYAVNL